MRRRKTIDADKIISDGISRIKSGMRTVPDPELWNTISGTLQNEGSDTGFSEIEYLKSKAQAGIRKPILKLAGSITAAAAAFVAGIIMANLYYTGSAGNEKDTYKQEIYAESSDFTGMNDKVIEYYDVE